MKRIKTGIEGLDDLLYGGLPYGKVILVSGSCGTGKTTFATQFISQGSKSKERCVYVSFEQPKDKLIEDVKEFGIDLSKMEVNGSLRIIGGTFGHINYYKRKIKASASDIVEEIKEVVEETGAKRVVIDSINLFLMLFEDDTLRRYAMAELASMLSKLDCTALMTCEVPENSGQLSWYGFEDFVVDGVILLHRIPFENMYERAVSIVKMRGISHSQAITASQITDNGVKVYPGKEPFHKPKK